MKRAVAAIYFLLGLASAFVCFQSLMWAVWGAPTNWTQYVGLLSSLITAGGALGLLISGEKGQGICMIGAVGMGCFYVPAIQSIIPAANTIISPLNYAVLAGYLALISTVTLYPKRIKVAAVIIGFVVFAMGAWAGMTAFDRWHKGEFNRPLIIGFLASRSAQPLLVSEEYARLVPIGLRDEITKMGIGGPLRWQGSAGDEGRSVKMLVIASSRIASPKELRYPKQGVIVYVWNGEHWSSFPADADCYSAFATLQVDGMLSNELTTGGVQSVYFYPWQKP